MFEFKPFFYNIHKSTTLNEGRLLSVGSRGVQGYLNPPFRVELNPLGVPPPRRYLAPKKIDPKLLDPKHIFEELDLNPAKKANVMQLKKESRHRDGYDHVRAALTPTPETLLELY